MHCATYTMVTQNKLHNTYLKTTKTTYLKTTRKQEAHGTTNGEQRGKWLKK